MSFPAGKTVYTEEFPPCRGMGISLTDPEVTSVLTEEIAPQVLDAAGNDQVASMMAAVVETDFEQEQIAEVLSGHDEIENWSVGEALAEMYLTDNHECYFPWPTSRDERKPNVSLPGADLVGFRILAHGDARFAYGEVKTSSDDSHPPAVVYGPHGLQNQLEDLRDNKRIRRDLLKYLGYRASGATWEAYFLRASKRYLQNDSDVCLFGVLIRDVEPDPADLKDRVHNIGTACPPSMGIELLALYLPNGRISQLGADVVQAVSQGGAP